MRAINRRLRRLEDISVASARLNLKNLQIERREQNVALRAVSVVNGLPGKRLITIGDIMSETGR
jgi:hypothetical protein